MLNRPQRAVIAALAGLAIYLAWADRNSSPNSQQSAQIQSAEKSDSGNTKGGQKETSWYDPLVIVTLGLVFVGAIQAAFFLVQLRFIRESLDDAKIAADAAKDGAKAARESADIARDALVLSNRAYVILESIRAGGVEKDGQFAGWHFSPNWMNRGNTPTKSITQWTAFDYFEPNIPDDYVFEPLNVGEKREYFIGPGAHAHGGTIIILMEMLEKAFAGTGKIFIWAKCDYYDVFEGTPPRTTEICVQLQIDNATFRSQCKDAPFTYGGYKTHNRQT